MRSLRPRRLPGPALAAVIAAPLAVPGRLRALPRRTRLAAAGALTVATAALTMVSALSSPTSAQPNEYQEAVAQASTSLPANTPPDIRGQFVAIPGTELTLPGPGRYEVEQQVRGEVHSQPGVVTGGGVTSRLFNLDTGQEIPNSWIYLIGRFDYSSTNAEPGYASTGTGRVYLHIKDDTRIQIQARRWQTAGQVTRAEITSNEDGQTKLSFLKL